MALIKHSERTIRKGCYCHGRTDLYWAHDTSQTTYAATNAYHAQGEAVKPCSKCDVTGAMVLIEPNGYRHDTNGRSDSESTPDDAPEPAQQREAQTERERRDSLGLCAMPDCNEYRVAGYLTCVDHNDDDVPAPESKPKPLPELPAYRMPATENPQAAALAALQTLLSPQIDRVEIERLVKAEFQNVAFPTRTVVITPTETREVTGDSHNKLADVVTDLSIGENVLMVGPAGTGKSTIAKQAAEALSYPYGEISLNPTLTATSILGYMNATGDYIRTVFREIWEHGGLFHGDEFDNGHPSTLATLNAALACSPGGSIAFPDGMIARHDDFRFVASANTFGRGPDRVYVGRQQLDAATLDRFVVEEIPVDEALEHAACIATGYDSPKVSEVLRYVRQLRHNAERHKMTLVFSPRASIGMCRLLMAGKALSATVESRVRKGISDSDWSKVTDGVNLPSV